MVTQVKWKVGALAALMFVVAGPVWAQRQVQPQTGQQGAQQGQRIQTDQPGQVRPGQVQQRTTLRPVERQGENLADRQIASWLLLANEMEVQVAQLAAKQSKNNQVRQFGESMVKEHGSLIDQLRQFAPDAPSLGGQPGQERTAARDESRQDQPQNRQQDQPNADQRGQAAQGQQHGLPLIKISHQLAERGLSSIRKELSQKQGSDFDKAFVGMQIHGHMNCLNTLEVLRPYASPQLAKVIEQAIPSTQTHLQHAKQIMEELKGTQESRTSDRSERDARQNNNRQDNNDQPQREREQK